MESIKKPKILYFLIIIILLFTYSIQAHAEISTSKDTSICSECQENNDLDICRNVKPDTVTISLPAFILEESTCINLVQKYNRQVFLLYKKPNIIRTVSYSELARSHL